MIAYYVWMLCSAVLCAVVFYFTAHGLDTRQKLCLLSLPLGIALGAAVAKLVYYFTQISFVLADGWLSSLVNPEPAQWCFFGGGMGACAGVCLAARMTHTPVMPALNAFAPAGALMVALARFGGWFLREELVGVGECVYDPALCFFPVTVVNQWGEHYLAVFMLEGLCALITAIVALTCMKERRFLRTLFYVCLPQIFCESLHNDSISWLFVRVEQLLCMVVVMTVLVYYALRSPRKPIRFLPPIVGALCAALFVGVEFALDKTDWSLWLIYGAMLLGLLALAVAENVGFRQARGSESKAVLP